ncbi:transducin beta-like 3 [Cyanidiococcus yangmingshanensis]|uniref:Transducin beta-like 3 n=1 Tax=Cyanidiococcus yangmingshanensis TaxID=2690220 RepID=A0A7J7IKU6_9RHOD|nr:transducin beta-like 3 [Cyanidiococcus yangmingshanensis]
MVQSSYGEPNCIWETTATYASVHTSGKVVSWPIDRSPSGEQALTAYDGYSWGGVLTQSYGRAMACLLIYNSRNGTRHDPGSLTENEGVNLCAGGAILEPALLLQTRVRFGAVTREDDLAPDDEVLTAMACSADGEQAVLGTRSGYAYLFQGLGRYRGLVQERVASCVARQAWTDPLPTLDPDWSWLPFGTDAHVVVDWSFDASAQFLACASARGEVRVYHLGSRSVIHRFRSTSGHGLVTCIRFLDHADSRRDAGETHVALQEQEQTSGPSSWPCSVRDRSGATLDEDTEPRKRLTLEDGSSPERTFLTQASALLRRSLSEPKSGSLLKPPHTSIDDRASTRIDEMTSRQSLVPPILLIGCEDGTIYAGVPSARERLRSVREHSSAVLHLGVVNDTHEATASSRVIVSAGLEPFLLVWDERLQRPRQTIMVGEATTAVLPIYHEHNLAGWMVATMSGSVCFFAIEDTTKAVKQPQAQEKQSAWLPLMLQVESGAIRMVQRGRFGGSSTASSAPEETADRDDTVAVLSLLAWPPGTESNTKTATSSSTVLISASDQSLHLVQLSSRRDERGHWNWDWQILATIMGNLDEVYSLAIVQMQRGRIIQRALASATNAHAIMVTGVTDNYGFGALSFQRTLIGHTDAVLCVSSPPALPAKAVAPPDLPHALLVSVSKDSVVRLWDVEQAQCRGIGRGHTAALNAVACGWFLARGRWRLWIASAGEDLALKLWSTAEENPLTPVSIDAATALECWCTVARAHEREIHSLASSPNSRYLASASQDKTVRLWRIACSRDGHPQVSPLHVLKGHHRSVWHVCFARTEPVMASASADRTIRIWSVPNGVCLRQLEAGGAVLSTRENGLGSFLCGAFLDHDTKFVVGSAQGILYLWHWRTGELLGEICSRASLGTKQDKVSFARSSAHHDRIWSLTAVDMNRLSERELEGTSTREDVHDQLITGSADGTIKCWRDVSTEERARWLERQEARLEQDQQLQRALARGNYTEALNWPTGPFAQDPLKSIEAIEAAWRALNDAQDVWRLVNYIREWCTHRRTAVVAQMALRALFRVYSPPTRLWSVLRTAGQNAETLRALQTSLIAYTERQASQLLRLQDELQLLAYAEMRSRMLVEPTQKSSNESASLNDASENEMNPIRNGVSVSATPRQIQEVHTQAMP